MTLNLHGRRVNVESIERKGSALIMKHQPDILKSDDPWFRGIEISQGPDGAVTILDWSDIGECHDQDGIHRSTGRIFKVSYGEPRQPNVDFAKASPAELVELQRSKNEWLVRMARWELRERAWKGVDLSSATAAWEKLAAETDPVLALNAHSTLVAMRTVKAGRCAFRRTAHCALLRPLPSSRRSDPTCSRVWSSASSPRRSCVATTPWSGSPIRPPSFLCTRSRKPRS
jgi:hypothetical protein